MHLSGCPILGVHFSFPRAVIELIHYPVDLILGDGREIMSFREVLANEAIGVFI